MAGTATVRQLTYVGPGRLEWREVPAPRLRAATDALVVPVAVGNCDLDQVIVQGRTPFPPPIALGHEFVAEVAEVGEQVTSVSPGRLVVVPFQVSCGECARCRAGLTANCTTAGAEAMYGFGSVAGDWGGGLTDLLRVPFADHMLVPLPDGVPPEAVPAAGDNLSDAWRAIVPQLRARPGADVLVCAESPSPAYLVDIAVAHGASRVHYADPHAARRDFAASLGATPLEISGWPRRLGRYAITANCSPSREALACAIRSTAPGGVCLQIFPFFDDPEPPVPLFEMFIDDVALLAGRPHVRPHLPSVLEAVRDGVIHPEFVTGAQVSWHDAIEALLGPQRRFVMVRER